MQPIIKSSSELQKNYDSIAEICRTNKVPVFLTRNGEGDMVLMDIESFGLREENLATAERLIAAEMARITGAQSYTINQFKTNMKQAIERGAGKDA